MKTFLKLLDTVLSIKELDGDNKILLSKIIELHTRGKGCWMSNGEFGVILGMSRTSVSKRITKLVELGFIVTRNVPSEKNNTKRFIIPLQKRWVVPEVKGGSSPSSKGVVPEVNGG
jgi:predicted transcriptional regulator